MAFKFNRRFNINRVVSRLVYTILALYVGGTILTTFGAVMNGTTSPFYSGLSLIGWTVGAFPTNGSHWATTCAAPHTYSVATSNGANCITSVSGSGVLAVIGVIAIAGVVLEFISF